MRKLRWHGDTLTMMDGSSLRVYCCGDWRIAGQVANKTYGWCLFVPDQYRVDLDGAPAAFLGEQVLRLGEQKWACSTLAQAKRAAQCILDMHGRRDDDTLDALCVLDNLRFT